MGGAFLTLTSDHIEYAYPVRFACETSAGRVEVIVHRPGRATLVDPDGKDTTVWVEGPTRRSVASMLRDYGYLPKGKP